MKSLALLASLLFLPSIAEAEHCVISDDHKTFHGCEKIYKLALFVSGSSILWREPRVNESLEYAMANQSRIVNEKKCSTLILATHWCPMDCGLI